MKETTGLQKLFPWSNPLKKASTLFNANTNCDWKSQYFASWELLDSEHGSSLMECMKLVEMVDREVPSRYSGLMSASWESETWVIPLRLCFDCFLAEWRNIGSSAAAWMASEKTDEVRASCAPSQHLAGWAFLVAWGDCVTLGSLSSVALTAPATRSRLFIAPFVCSDRLYHSSC